MTLTQVIDRWVGDLCKTLAEIRRHGTGATGKRGERGVVAHGRGGLVAGRRRRAEEEGEVLAREAGRDLARGQVLRRREARDAGFERSDRGSEPAGVGSPARQPVLDDAALLDAV